VVDSESAASERSMSGDLSAVARMLVMGVHG
jgi:hypothetical protein